MCPFCSTLSKKANFSNSRLKFAQDDNIADLYRNIIYDRVTQMALAIGGASKPALQMSAVVSQKKKGQEAAGRISDCASQRDRRHR